MSEIVTLLDFAESLKRGDPRLSSMYNYVRALQIEGTLSSEKRPGVWPVSAMRVYRGWGTVRESDWPDAARGNAWPPHEPPGLDAKAKALRCHHYQRVRSASDCRGMLGMGTAVGVSIEITNQWFHAERGMITMPGPGDEIVGSHCVSILGFDLASRSYHFVNSWGSGWGNGGFGYLPFEYLDRYLRCSWIQSGMGVVPDYLQVPGVQSIGWRQPDMLGHSFHGGDTLYGVEVNNGTTDERMGWAFAVHRDGCLDVEELFVRPEYRGKGVAGKLIELLEEVISHVKRPVRMWIPYADWTPANVPAIEKIAARLGLALFQTDQRWAAAAALHPSGVADSLGKPLRRIPPGSMDLGKPMPSPPASCCLRDAPACAESRRSDRDRYPLRGTPIRYTDPTAPVAETDWEALH